jgi:hypothetical protein
MRIPALILVLALAPAASWAADSGDHPHRGEAKERILAKFDTNHDGKLDESERAALKAAIQAHRGQFKAKHPELFAKIDTNHDGKIERDEAKAWRAEHPRRHDGEGRREKAN